MSIFSEARSSLFFEQHGFYSKKFKEWNGLFMLLLYTLLAGSAAAAALLILYTPHLLYAALGLLLVILSMAAIYFLQGASFIAIAHVVVYGSSVLVMVLLSSLMLPLESQKNATRPNWVLLGLVTGLLGKSLWLLVSCATRALQQQVAVVAPKDDGVAGLGLQLLGPYVLAFEWVGLTLLITLVGAACVMKR